MKKTFFSLRFHDLGIQKKKRYDEVIITNKDVTACTFCQFQPDDSVSGKVHPITYGKITILHLE